MLKKMSSPISSVRSLIVHPIFIIAIIGIAARLALIPILQYGYDMDYWAVIIRNLESGQGLYAVEGYYYTPVWGYFLSFLSMIQSLFLHIDIMGLRVPETFALESLYWGITSNVTAVAFNTFIKTPLVIIDILVGYLIYWLIKDRTQDMKKATIGFALWILCPLVIVVTSAAGMFDSLSVLFALLCIIMLRKDKLFLAGVLFTFAVLTKFFPVYLLFILMAYVIVVHRSDGKMVRSLLTAGAGTLAAFLVLMLPMILNGEFTDSFDFLTSRAVGNNTEMYFGFNMNIMVNVFCFAAALLAGYLLSQKSKEKVDDYFFIYALPLVLIPFMIPGLPQYLVLTMPFLIMIIVCRNHRYLWIWLLLTIGGTLFVLARYFGLMVSLGVFTDLVPLDHVISMIFAFEDPFIFGMGPTELTYYISRGALLGAFLGLIFIVIEWYILGRRGGEVSGSKIAAFVFSFRIKWPRLRDGG